MSSREPESVVPGAARDPGAGFEMTPERWQQIKTVFGATLERDPAERAAYLQCACGADETLRVEVESLLAAAQGAATNAAKAAPSVDAALGPGSTRSRPLGAYELVLHVLRAALELAPEQRPAYLDLACPADSLRREVEALLATHDDARSGFRKFPPAPRSTLVQGTKLGDYEIVSLLGSGSMGDVYCARDPRLQRAVAIKVLPSFLSSDPDRLRRFEHEARAVASLNHPHVVTIHSIEEAGGVHFLTMELVEGQTLDRLIPDGGLPLEQFFEFAESLAAAVAAAHSKGIVHRDLKPGNIMVDTRGSIKVLDFGVAKMAEPAEPGSQDSRLSGHSPTEPGMVIGTLPYMSPEQLQGKNLDHRSDLFSLGAVLYEMATGQRPFSGDTPAELMSSILRDRTKPVTELRADLPTSLERVLERCLAKEVADRYASAQDLLAAIGRLRREFSSGLHASAISSPEASVAVLPFLNLSADPENEFFADGITEEIINALAQIKSLHVAARTSSFSFKGKHVDLRVISERLNVRTVLEGSVRRAGNEVRITAQLVNLADGYHLWSEKYDREMKDIFAIQDEIARSIAERLKVTLESEQPLVKAGTDNLEAYQLYLKGRALFFQRGPRLRRAFDCFKRAVLLDANYALAWAALADAYNMLAFYGLSHPEVCLPQAKEASVRAVTLDPLLAEAHTALALTHLFCDWDQPKAELEFLRALELNPRYLQARDWYGVFYLQWVAGRLEEGIAQTKHAAEFDPLSGYAKGMLAAACLNAGKLDDALQAAQAALPLDPDSFLSLWTLFIALHGQGRFEEAVAAGESALAISGRHPWIVASLALICTDWGKPEEAKAMYMELQWRAKRDYLQPSALVWAASAAGEQEEAIRYAREGYLVRDPAMLASRYWPCFARARKDPRFEGMMIDLGLK
ncbi:MAG: protein kinase [Terriglobales bacterium]